jgi:hypothetical protein
LEKRVFAASANFLSAVDVLRAFCALLSLFFMKLCEPEAARFLLGG